MVAGICSHSATRILKSEKNLFLCTAEQNACIKFGMIKLGKPKGMQSIQCKSSSNERTFAKCSFIITSLVSENVKFKVDDVCFISWCGVVEEMDPEVYMRTFP